MVIAVYLGSFGLTRIQAASVLSSSFPELIRKTGHTNTFPSRSEKVIDPVREAVTAGQGSALRVLW